MEALELKAELRQLGKGHAKSLRLQGYVPAIMYGQGKEAQLLQIQARELEKVLAVAGTHQLVALQVASNKPVMTLARDIQRDVIKREYLHVDFYTVNMAEKVHAQVPLHLVGHAPAVDAGGVLTHGLDMVEVECLPSDLVAAIEVNVSGLVKFSDSISVADLQVPATITILSDPESMVAKVEAPRKAEDLAALDEVDAAFAEPEVITEVKNTEE